MPFKDKLRGHLSPLTLKNFCGFLAILGQLNAKEADFCPMLHLLLATV